MHNPFVMPDDRLPFDAFRPEHVAPAIAQLIAEARAGIDGVVGRPVDIETLERLLQLPMERLSRAWGVVSHLANVIGSAEWRDAQGASMPAINAFFSLTGSDPRLFETYKRLDADRAALSPVQRHMLQSSLQAFELNGVALAPPSRQRFMEISARLGELGKRFSENVTDATDRFALYVPESELAGIPADVLRSMNALAGRDDKDGCRVRLDDATVSMVLRHAHSRSLRQRLYRAYTTLASDLGDAETDNTAAMVATLTLRQEMAALLRLRSYAHLSLRSKMADSPEQVESFLLDLAAKAKPFAERDLALVWNYAHKELGLDALEAWDLAYAAERLKRSAHDLDARSVRQYFTLPSVLDGLFRLIERMFDVTIMPCTLSAWHVSVQTLRIERRGEHLGDLYLDLYARAGKRGGAWMNPARARWRRPDGTLQRPAAYLISNFAPPMDGQPTLLSHGDVTMLFHESGHVLHQLLSQVEELAASGTSGVEWDAVELPSQFFENLAWQWGVMERFTAHAESGQPMPRAMFDKIVAARNFQSGLRTISQLQASLIDLRLHARPGCESDIQAVVDQVRKEVGVMPVPSFNRFQHTFQHIFAGGYAAGFYSYKWAEVLSSDAWGAFEEEGIFDAAVATRYRQEILEVGGGRPAADSFRAFRGRDPTPEAMLRSLGMTA